MPPQDRDPPMAAAEGIIIGLAVSLLGVVAVAAGVAWGEPLLRRVLWTVATLAEVLR